MHVSVGCGPPSRPAVQALERGHTGRGGGRLKRFQKEKDNEEKSKKSSPLREHLLDSESLTLGACESSTTKPSLRAQPVLSAHTDLLTSASLSTSSQVFSAHAAVSCQRMNRPAQDILSLASMLLHVGSRSSKINLCMKALNLSWSSMPARIAALSSGREACMSRMFRPRSEGSFFWRSNEELILRSWTMPKSLAVAISAMHQARVKVWKRVSMGTTCAKRGLLLARKRIMSSNLFISQGTLRPSASVGLVSFQAFANPQRHAGQGRPVTGSCFSPLVRQIALC
mmetsp:Transcript_270/g.645  ORF Transcript_270/g.645 Transcript_270/m.645 type:complete len:284 (-) Transcript_270:1484-2335(-)